VSVPFFVVIVYILFFTRPNAVASDMFIIDRINDVTTVRLERGSDLIIVNLTGLNSGNASAFASAFASAIINDKYPANPKSIKKLRQVLTEVKIHKPIPKNEVESVREELKLSGTRVSVYDEKDKLIKKWYLGSYEKDQNGSYMIEEKSREPYIVHIPGLEDNLNERYNTNILYWIRPEIFTYQPQDIREITVQYKDTPQRSFKLVIGKDDAKLTGIGSEHETGPLDHKRIGSFLSYFMNVKFSGFSSKLQKDSILAEDPDYLIDVTDAASRKKSVKLFRIQKEDNTYDPFKLFALINNEDLVIVNYTDIDLILKEPEYFIQH
jgi:hypothetical protein